MPPKTVSQEKLTRFASRVFERLGIPSPDASTAASLLVAADLRGFDTHGVAHLGQFYVQRIQKGFINVKPNIQVSSGAAATAVVDGDNGLGFLVGSRAMNEAIQRARDCGVGLVAVRNGTHFGAASVYSMMALPHGMIGITLSSTGPLVVPPGSTSRGVGTNPLSLAVPAADGNPFVLDMATSVVPGGKISDAMRKGQPIPLGWAVDSKGSPTTRPEDVFKGGGGLVPLGSEPQLGSYKGFGLGVAVEILCSILSGAVAGLLMVVPPGAAGNRCDHLFGAIRLDGFVPVDGFRRRMEDLFQAYHGLPMAGEGARLRLAGENENEMERRRRLEGIPLHEKVVQSLEQIATELSLPFDL